MEEEAEFESANDLFHVIFENGDFRSDLDNVLKQWSVYNSGVDYNVYAILGPQSSGKSTLLNGLFGTSFPTMRSEDGRSQCTKGIWMGQSRATLEGGREGRSTVVLDVEGTDGRERGEKEKAFERKTSLFSLVLAEVLIVNMWMTDIGRSSAANIPLLRTVFDLNMQLFLKESDRSKTLLVFVIRDHIRESTSLEKLRKTIEADLRGIWNGLKKPEAFEKTALEDFFNLEYVSLPHKYLRAEEFTKEVAELSLRFNDPEREDFFWKKEYENDIPIDGLATFAEKLWDKVDKNKDLDLPSERRVMALVRCGAISEEAYTAFQEQSSALRTRILVKGTMEEDFAGLAHPLLDACLETYTSTARRYETETMENEKEKLRTAVLKDLKEMWKANLSLSVEHTIAKYRTALKAKTKKANTNFVEAVEVLHKEIVEAFIQACEKSTFEGWDCSREVEQVRAAIADIVEKEKEVLLKKVMESARQDLKKYAVVLDDILSFPDIQMWDKIRNSFGKMCEKSNSRVQERLKMFDLSESKLEDLMEEIQEAQKKFLRKKITSEIYTLNYRMEKAFDGVFKVDSKGLPRTWKPGVDILSIFKKASEAGYLVLELFSVMRLDAEDEALHVLQKSRDDAEKEEEEGKDSKDSEEGDEIESRAEIADKLLMTLNEVRAVKDKFDSYSHTVCADARNQMEHFGKATAIPTYMFVLLLLFGFNEIWYVLSNPILLSIVIVLGLVGVVMYFTGTLRFAIPVIQKSFDAFVAGSQAFLSGKVQVHDPVSHEKEKKE